MRKQLGKWIKDHFCHNGQVDMLPLICVILAIVYMALVAYVIAFYAA